MNEEKFKEILELFKEKTKKECYKIELINETPDILDDKIGGIPYLPIGEKYPKDSKGNDLALLLQINFKNIDLENYPKEGILEIFTEKILDYPYYYEIRYFKEGLEYQKDIPKIDLEEFVIIKPQKIKLTKTNDYMSPNDYRYKDVIKEIINNLEEKNKIDYKMFEDFINDEDLYDELYTSTIINKATIGGYPNFTQNDPRKFSNKNKTECLFKLDNNLDENIINIGDAGILFVLIAPEEIKKEEFNKAILDWDCF